MLRNKSVSLRANDAYDQGQYINDNSGSGGAAVWSDRPHVVGIASAFASASHEESAVCHFVGPGWKDRLSHFASGLSKEELDSCHVAEYEHVALCNPWSSVPLHRAVTVHRTDWFRSALDHNAVAAHLQPIYCLKTRQVIGFEALARANVQGTERNGAELVSAAAAHGMATEFDMIARRAAIRLAGTELFPDEHLFVNVLPSSLPTVREELDLLWRDCERAGVPTNKIVFELVESESLPHGELMYSLTSDIRERGAKLALDDFGAGFGTLAWIEEIRPEIVKFDRKLVAGEATAERAGLLKGLVDYLHAAGAQTVAEGIETVEQLDLATDAGFDLGQGWLLGRPSPRAQRPSPA